MEPRSTAFFKHSVFLRKGVVLKLSSNKPWSTAKQIYVYKTSLLGILVDMNTSSPQARALAALGHDARLSIFRLLVKAGDDGLRISDIGQLLELAPSTLSHHLKALVDGELVLQQKQGREVFNIANYASIQSVLDFLTSECCVGVSLKQTEDVA